MSDFYKNITVGVLSAVVTLGAFGAGAYGAVALNCGSLLAAAAQSQKQPPAVALADSELLAKSAVLYDLDTKRVLYQKNAYEQLPLASLTKLMAIEVVLSVKSPDTPVQITRDDLQPDGDSGFSVGQTVMLGDLIKFAIVASSNDAMEAAAASLGDGSINKMNAAAEALGLNQTHFFNATGLDITEKTSGAYGSAYDVARLAALFYHDHPDYFELTTRPDVAITAGSPGGGDGMLVAEATALPLQQMPGFVAAKTGYTDLAGGNLVAVFDLQPGTTVVAVAMGSTHEGRFSDVIKLIEAARASLSKK